MLAMSDKNGEVHASIPGLARVASMSIQDAENAIGKLMSPDQYSRTPDNEGRRIAKIDGGWELLNHAKYRLMASREDEKAATAERVRRHRNRNANVTECNGDVTDSNDGVTVGVHIADTDTDTKAKKNRSNTAFEKPTEEMILEYGKTLTPQFNDAIGFLDYYESNGWKVGSSKMKDWKATVRRWTRNQIPKAKNESTSVLQMGLSAISSDFAPAKPQKTVNLAAEMGI